MLLLAIYFSISITIIGILCWILFCQISHITLYTWLLLHTYLLKSQYTTYRITVWIGLSFVVYLWYTSYNLKCSLFCETLSFKACKKAWICFFDIFKLIYNNVLVILYEMFKMSFSVFTNSIPGNWFEIMVMLKKANG